MKANTKILQPAKVISPTKAHECFECTDKIKAKDKCTKVVYSYDGHLIAAFTCVNCKPIL